MPQALPVRENIVDAEGNTKIYHVEVSGPVKYMFEVAPQSTMMVLFPATYVDIQEFLTMWDYFIHWRCFECGHWHLSRGQHDDGNVMTRDEFTGYVSDIMVQHAEKYH